MDLYVFVFTLPPLPSPITHTIPQPLLTPPCTKPITTNSNAFEQGRFPLLSFFLTGTLLILCCGMSVFNPCLEMKSFNIDKNTQNYIKSVSKDTDSYDAMWAAIEDGMLNGGRSDGSRRALAIEVGDEQRSLTGTVSTSVSFVYIAPHDKLPKNVFTEDNLLEIRDYELGLMNLPDYTKYCRKVRVWKAATNER